eukprot:CAMPEP_0116854104 /NCGR_PEP_ID=MMETSP0418-20121206/18375_1 /TAXON_ID=1158023 /ORGANISM="Astrosyne radiata, Strain 13vi08-1A" /LENGTH=37 /DNA_ID= /DNA_START= /DNA_END= /DNA_ORIENTATION=
MRVSERTDPEVANVAELAALSVHEARNASEKLCQVSR